jgi:hypothetical protein
MSGGITQLVAVGAQDAHLVGNPEVSFFRSIYRRHTNFSHVVERQVIQGNPRAGGISTVRFERKGDLLGYVYLTEKDGLTSNVFGDNVIDKVEILIGGQVIDTQDNNFTLNVADPLLVSSVTKAAASPNSTMYPLHFWFCENYQSALPLVSLQYHDVELRITWGTGVDTSRRYECWADFVYLDTDERTELANAEQNILIYQVQKSIGVSTKTHEFNFNHPVKFLASNLSVASTKESDTLKLQINGVDVSSEKTYTPHFNTAPRYFHCPYLSTTATADDDDTFLMPFCLDTNKLQPTGTLNFSRLDSARLISSNNLAGRVIYAVNYNILRIQNGMGGLMYSN